MEEDLKVGESSSQTQVKENEPKFQVQSGNLPEKVDCFGCFLFKVRIYYAQMGLLAKDFFRCK